MASLALPGGNSDTDTGADAGHNRHSDRKHSDFHGTISSLKLGAAARSRSLLVLNSFAGKQRGQKYKDNCLDGAVKQVKVDAEGYRHHRPGK